MKTTTLLEGHGEWEDRLFKAGDKYWYIGFDYDDDIFAGDPRAVFWRDNQMDENRLKLGNAFSTKKEAYKFRDFLYNLAKKK